MHSQTGSLNQMFKQLNTNTLFIILWERNIVYFFYQFNLPALKSLFEVISDPTVVDISSKNKKKSL